jgi:hypothetical protein
MPSLIPMNEVHWGVIQNVIVVVFHVIETWTGIATGHVQYAA